MALAVVAGAAGTCLPLHGEPEGMELQLDVAQAVGGQSIQTGQGRMAVRFPGDAPLNDRIIWRLGRPLPPGLWRIELEFLAPDSAFSPNQVLLFEGEGGISLGSLDLYYHGYAKGHDSRALGLVSTRPLTGVALSKSRQRGLATVGVASIRISRATAAMLEPLPLAAWLPVDGGGMIQSPIPLPTGLYVLRGAKPLSARWNPADGRGFSTPKAAELRCFLEAGAFPVISSGDRLDAVHITRFPADPGPAMRVAGNPPLMATHDLKKIETGTLVLEGYKGGGLPVPDVLPGGTSVAFVTSWDDGQPMDLTLAGCLSKHGVRGTLYMNRGSKVMAQWRELESMGMEIGSHSWSHPAFYHSSPQRCLDEAVEMRRFLEQETGHPVISFAYPFNYLAAYDAGGDYVLRSLRQAGYWSGRATTNGGQRIDAIPEPLAFRPDFHFKAGAAVIGERLDRLRKDPGGILHVWGHSYELAGDGMDALEGLLARVSGQPDVWYATMGELMVWQFMRRELRIEPGLVTSGGQTFTLKMPWLHPHLRSVPLSLIMPEGVSSVSWNGRTLPVVERRVRLSW